MNSILARKISDHTSSNARVRPVASRRRKIVRRQTGEISIFQGSKRSIEALKTSIQGERTSIQAITRDLTILNLHQYEGDSKNQASGSEQERSSIGVSYRAAVCKSRLSGIEQRSHAQTIYNPSENNICVIATHPGRRTLRDAVKIPTGSEKSQSQGAAYFTGDCGVTDNTLGRRLQKSQAEGC